jgi:hypothetical protein
MECISFFGFCEGLPSFRRSFKLYRKNIQLMKFLKFFLPFRIRTTTATVSYILPRSMATQGIIREENGFRIREGGHQDSILNDVSPLLLLLKQKRALIAIDK